MSWKDLQCGKLPYQVPGKGLFERGGGGGVRQFGDLSCCNSGVPSGILRRKGNEQLSWINCTWVQLPILFCVYLGWTKLFAVTIGLPCVGSFQGSFLLLKERFDLRSSAFRQHKQLVCQSVIFTHSLLQLVLLKLVFWIRCWGHIIHIHRKLQREGIVQEWLIATVTHSQKPVLNKEALQ